jgi:hypothetical protein
VSRIPEFILHAVLVRGIRTLRNDSRFIDQLFRNLDQKALAQIRKFVLEQIIDLCINYPRGTLKVPAIIILLKGESEAQAFLADSMGVSTPDQLSYDGDVEGEILGGTASISDMNGQGLLEFGPYTALSGTSNTLKIAAKEWAIDKFVGRGLRVNLVAGTGIGQSRGIVANSVNTLMVDIPWTVVPDDTTIFEIRAPASEIIGEPSKIYDRRGKTFIEQRGQYEAKNYQIQVIGGNPEQTIYLATIVKAIFTLMRTFLESQGIINLKMSATDFVPKTDYQPDFAYMRAITVEFLSPFEIFEELGGVADQIRIAIEVDNENPDNIVVSDQTITVGLPDTSVGP